jgi:hypothetical protein
MDRVTQRLWRGVEGPRRCLLYPCCSEFSTTEADSRMAAENVNVGADHSQLASCSAWSQGTKRSGPPARGSVVENSEQHG